MTEPFTQVADHYVATRGKGALEQLLQDLVGSPRPVTPLHESFARLAGTGCFQAIVTTNYDDVIERALANAGVDRLVQTLDRNEAIATPGLRVHKLHGSQDDWKNAVLSGQSYADFDKRYAFLRSQLDVLLRQHPVLFAGCSMMDPRLFDWLAGAPGKWTDSLKPWRPMMRRKAWDEAVTASKAHGKDPLARGNVRPLLVERHEDLPALWKAAADELAPVNEDLALDVTVSPAGWEVRFPSCEAWTVADPAADEVLRKRLEELESDSPRPLPTSRDGHWLPDVARKAAELVKLAEVTGAQLTEKLLSGPALDLLARAIRTGQGSGGPPLLRIRMQADAAGPDGQQRVDAALALPWELLWVEGCHPVREGTLDVAREAVVEDMPGLDAPSQPLSVVATVSAPREPHLARTRGGVLAPLEGHGRTGAVHHHHRHRDAGGLRQGRATPEAGGVPLQRARQARLPRLRRRGDRAEPGAGGRAGAGLARRQARAAAPAGVPRGVLRGAGNAGAVARPAARFIDPASVSSRGAPSTAARLHAAGFPQVVAYFSPVDDQQSTRIEALFYEALAKGRSARAAVRKARLEASRPLKGPDGACTHGYPLGWAQLALYHRGEDVPAATAVTSAGAAASSLAARPRRVVELRGGVAHLEQGFIGRRRPRAKLIRAWRQGSRAMVVHGLGGLGKTTLCTEALPVLARAQAGANGEPAFVVVLNGQALEGEAEPLAALWAQLGAWVYLDNVESLQHEAIGTWKHPGGAVLWKSLLGVARPGSRFGLLASTRYVPEETPDAAQLSLEQMKQMDVLRLLRWIETLGEMPASDAEWLIGRLDGLPRTVESMDVDALEAGAQRGCRGGRRRRFVGGHIHGAGAKLPCAGQQGHLNASKYRETVRSETLKPSIRSSPWIRGAPQVGFSAAILRIRSRRAGSIVGRPTRRRWESHVQ